MDIPRAIYQQTHDYRVLKGNIWNVFYWKLWIKYYKIIISLPNDLMKIINSPFQSFHLVYSKWKNLQLQPSCKANMMLPSPTPF